MTSRQRRYQKEMVQAGRCEVCGQAEYVKGYCQRHHEARTARRHERRGEIKQEQTCSLCGEQGHNKRTCPEKEAQEAEAEVA